MGLSYATGFRKARYELVVYRLRELDHVLGIGCPDGHAVQLRVSSCSAIVVSEIHSGVSGPCSMCRRHRHERHAPPVELITLASPIFILFAVLISSH